MGVVVVGEDSLLGNGHHLPVVKAVEAEEKTDDEAVAVAKKTVLPYYHHPLTYSGYYPYSYGYPYTYGYGLPVVKPAVAKKEKRSAEAEPDADAYYWYGRGLYGHYGYGYRSYGYGYPYTYGGYRGYAGYYYGK